MALLLVLITMSPPSFAQAALTAYEKQDAAALRSLFERADARRDSLLVRYRLFPLTNDVAVLEDIPSSLPNGGTRECALLSGLWAYRAGEGSVLSAVQYGRRSSQLLERAKEMDAEAPFVLLVEGQSLLFRPSIAGRDPQAAADRFAQLASIAEGIPGISRTEALVWRWLALREADQAEQAKALRARLKQQTLAPLYQQFLNDPPEV